VAIAPVAIAFNNKTEDDKFAFQLIMMLGTCGTSAASQCISGTRYNMSEWVSLTEREMTFEPTCMTAQLHQEKILQHGMYM